MLRALYVVLGLAIVGGYVYASMTGAEFTRTQKTYIAGGVRGQHGSGAAFWYGGYRGGK